MSPPTPPHRPQEAPAHLSHPVPPFQLSALLDLDTPQLMELVHARARRRFQRGLKRKPMALIKKLRKAKKDAPAGDKPAVVKTHLRDMIIVPEMIGSVIGIYNGKVFSAFCSLVCWV